MYQLVICTAFGCKRPEHAIYATLDACLRVINELSLKLDALLVCELIR